MYAEHRTLQELYARQLSRTKGSSPKTTQVLLELLLPKYLLLEYVPLGMQAGFVENYFKTFYIPVLPEEKTKALQDPTMCVLKLIHKAFETYKDFKESGLDGDFLIPTFHVARVESGDTLEGWHHLCKQLTLRLDKESHHFAQAIHNALKDTNG